MHYVVFPLKICFLSAWGHDLHIFTDFTHRAWILLCLRRKSKIMTNYLNNCCPHFDSAAESAALFLVHLTHQLTRPHSLTQSVSSSPTPSAPQSSLIQSNPCTLSTSSRFFVSSIPFGPTFRAFLLLVTFAQVPSTSICIESITDHQSTLSHQLSNSTIHISTRSTTYFSLNDGSCVHCSD